MQTKKSLTFHDNMYSFTLADVDKAGITYRATPSERRKKALLINTDQDFDSAATGNPQQTEVYFFDFDGTLTTHEDNDLTTPEEEFMFKKGALQQLQKLTKKGVVIIATNNIENLRSCIENNAEFHELPDFERILRQLVIIQPDSSKSLRFDKRETLHTGLDFLEKWGYISGKKNSITLYFSDDQPAQIESIQQFQDERVSAVHTHLQEQGNVDFILPTIDISSSSARQLTRPSLLFPPKALPDMHKQLKEPVALSPTAQLQTAAATRSLEDAINASPKTQQQKP